MSGSVLFLCVANSARSQMAEGLARHLGPEDLCVQSAGSCPSSVHPVARAVMAERGIELAGQHSKHVDSIDLDAVDTVITLCADEVCPVLPGGIAHLHWPHPDPAAAGPDPGALSGSFRAVRDQIEVRIRDWLSERFGPGANQSSTFR